MRMLVSACAVIAPLMIAVAAMSQSNTPAPCSSPQARLFDFWIGEWEVTANGKLAGHNTITSILGGCVLLEEYSNAAGTFSGKSFNYYDDAGGKWHQVWVDNTGIRLNLAGNYADGKMVMSGERVQNGATILDRITWHNNDDGTVRQVWDQSSDNGATWQTVFDGLYKMK